MDLEEMDKVIGIDDKWLSQRKTKLTFLYNNYSNPEITVHIKTIIDFIFSDNIVSTSDYEKAKDFLEKRDISA